MTGSKLIIGDMPHVPKAVSRHMAAMARKANAKMRGTPMAKRRAKKAARSRWGKK